VCRKVAREVAKSGNREKRINITPKKVQQYLGVPKFHFGLAEEHDQIGISTGLAWTEVGGELLTTEVSVLPGQGKLIVTGKLGDVMQESAQAAMSYVRSRAEDLGLGREFYSKVDIHVHLPEGAIPKDGPSAGITMATAIISALLRIPSRKDVAMTGEITLRGRVLPIGGLKEKALGALRAGIRTIVIPEKNKRDLDEIPLYVKKKINFIPVKNMSEVLDIAFKIDGE